MPESEKEVGGVKAAGEQWAGTDSPFRLTAGRPRVLSVAAIVAAALPRVI